ncbi:MAG: hypothetical protein MI919_24380 [Holophagales bacterium]|nr:hypothetical protein [Holophagales bacterium]
MQRSLLILFGLLPLLAFPKADAQEGNAVIVLSSTLVTVEANERTATVRATNGTAEPQRYRLSLVDMVMGDDGHLSAPAAESTVLEHSASSWVIATPASLELGPGDSQTIRLLVRRPAKLDEGEYRAHLRIAQEPPPGSAGGLDEDRPAGGMAFQITAVYSLSIPVVVKQGKPEVSARLAGARIIEPDLLALVVERQGNASFRGFAHAVGDAASADFPITIYRELQEVNLDYELDELAGAEGPLTLTLYQGAIPREGQPMPSRSLGSLIVTR